MKYCSFQSTLVALISWRGIVCFFVTWGIFLEPLLSSAALIHNCLWNIRLCWWCWWRFHELFDEVFIIRDDKIKNFVWIFQIAFYQTINSTGCFSSFYNFSPFFFIMRFFVQTCKASAILSTYLYLEVLFFSQVSKKQVK